MARQLSFDLPAQVSLGPSDFFVSEANAHAYAMVTTPHTWPEGKLALIGPKGSGKSHLARVFQHLTGALILPAAALTAPADLPEVPVVIEDMNALPRAAEETVFHLHNHLRARRLPLLLTAATAPSRWRLVLPDLSSRMQATPTVAIDDPDDRLLTAVLMKHFADRQLAPKPQVVAYLAAHIERSFSAAAEIVARLDRAALATNSPITIPLTRQVLDNFRAAQ